MSIQVVASDRDLTIITVQKYIARSLLGKSEDKK